MGKTEREKGRLADRDPSSSTIYWRDHDVAYESREPSNQPQSASPVSAFSHGDRDFLRNANAQKAKVSRSCITLLDFRAKTAANIKNEH